MAITGIRRLVYRVDDVAECTRFFEDIGLGLLETSSKGALLETRNGAQVQLLTSGHESLPASAMVGAGVQECVWAVDSTDSLERLVADLSRDHVIKTDKDGTVHLVTDFGQAIGLQVFVPRSVSGAPSPSNAPGSIGRLNQPRKWIARPSPKQIHHVVWLFPDVNRAFAFYRDRLNFRLTDVQKGFGVYVRADGAYEHHNLFIADGDAIVSGYDRELRFAHANFEVEDVDEIMVGKNYLERRGYKTTDWGFGRHRISSAAFLYIPCPAGGEAEYGADCDAVDDSWKPRIWNAAFGTAIYVHNLPDWLMQEPPWDVGYVTPETARHFTRAELEQYAQTAVAAE